MTTDSTITLTARCLCKTNVFAAEIPASKLPLRTYACHCTSCRHLTGALYSTGSSWPAPTSKVDLSKLKVYRFSDRFNFHFCGTCSTSLFFSHAQDPDAELGVFPGTLQNTPDISVHLDYHIYVGDTVDGGASMWLRKPNPDGSEAKRYKERDNGEALPYDWPLASTLTGYEKKLEDSLPIHCKCGGVNMKLHRGNYEGQKELPWFVDPTTHKLLSGFCICDSCRLSSGVDIFHWTYAELVNISFADGTTLPTTTADLKALVDAKDSSVGSLTYYASSHDVQRYFCSNCSACVFYAVDGRPTMVDVAIGLLEASDGARAEGFLSWALGKVGQDADVKGGWREGFKAQVEKESEQWREERGYPKNWRRVAREEAAAKGESYY